MTTIKYNVKRGYSIFLEVAESFAKEFKNIEEETRKEKERTRYYWRKKLNSYDEMIDMGIQLSEPALSPLEALIRKERYQELYQALRSLTSEQFWLVYNIFWLNKTRTAIACELGVGESAIRSRLDKIYTKLKKYLETGVRKFNSRSVIVDGGKYSYTRRDLVWLQSSTELKEKHTSSLLTNSSQKNLRSFKRSGYSFWTESVNVKRSCAHWIG